MNGRTNERVYADKVQVMYAKTLDFMAHTVIMVMAAAYFIYLFQLLPLGVPVETIAGNWHLSSAELQAKLDLPCGWSCFASMPALLHGDALSYASVILLSLATTICLVTAIAMFFSERNLLFSIMAALQVVVLLVAASGFFSSGR